MKILKGIKIKSGNEEYLFDASELASKTELEAKIDRAELDEIDLNAIKEQLKAEILAELRG